MRRSILRIATIAIVTAVALGASACAPRSDLADASGPNPTQSTSPRPSASPTPFAIPYSPSGAASVPPLTFADGATLSPDVEILWADGFANDDEWQHVDDAAAPGRWTYVNVDLNCTAAFRKGPLGDAGDMDDREATDAVIAAQLDEDPSELSPLLSDGYFLLGEHRDSGVEHRQFSYTINDVGHFIAARAFVAVDYSVHVSVKCVGTDVDSLAGYVMSKNWIVIEPE